MTDPGFYRLVTTMSPLNDWRATIALASPKEPRIERFIGGGRRLLLRTPFGPMRRVSGISERTLPLKVVASSSNPVLPAMARRSTPEWECQLPVPDRRDGSRQASTA